MTNETPVAYGEALKVGYQQKKGGTFVTFLLNEGPDDFFRGLVDLPLGTVLKIVVSTTEIGA